MIYRGSEDGFTAVVFHSKCDQKGPTLIIIKSEFGKIFGGFTDIDWTSKNGSKSGNGNSFVFSLRDDSNFVKLKCLKKEYEVFHNKKTLCSFG